MQFKTVVTMLTFVAAAAVSLLLAEPGMAQDAAPAIPNPAPSDPGPVPPAASDGEEAVLIVLDASGSMRGRMDGRAKWEIAKETLSKVVREAPPGRHLGLMVYGHKGGKCDDIEMLTRPGPGTGEAIVAAVEKLRPRGETPLAKSVRQAAEHLRFQEKPATVVVVTDGIESCGGDVCRLGMDLATDGIDFTAHVIGFGLTEKEGAQVACLAQNTGGLYLSANDAGQLKDTLAKVVEEPPVDAPEPQKEPPKPSAPAFSFDFKNGLDLTQWDVVGENKSRYGLIDGRLMVGGVAGNHLENARKQNLFLAKAALPQGDFDLSLDFTSTLGEPHSLVSVGIYKNEQDFVEAVLYRNPMFAGTVLVEARRVAGGQVTAQFKPISGLDGIRVGDDPNGLTRKHLDTVGGRLTLSKRGPKVFAQFEFLDPPQGVKVPDGNGEPYSGPIRTADVSLFSDEGRLSLLGGVRPCASWEACSGENVVRFQKVELRTP